MRLIEVIEGDDTSDETMQVAANFAQAIRKTAVRCGEVPGLRGQPDPHLVGVRGLARDRGGGARRQGGRQGDPGVRHGADGPVLPRPTCSGLDIGPAHVAEHLHDSYGERFYVVEADEGAGRGRATSARRPGRGSMSTASAVGPRHDRRPDGPEDPGRVLPRARGGRRLREGHRDRDDDGRRHPARAVHARRRGRASTRSSSSSSAPRRSGATPSSRPPSCGGWWRRAGWARRPARASSPTRSPTPATSARPCCSRRAAMSRSRG